MSDYGLSGLAAIATVVKGLLVGLVIFAVALFILVRLIDHLARDTGENNPWLVGLAALIGIALLIDIGLLLTFVGK